MTPPSVISALFHPNRLLNTRTWIWHLLGLSALLFLGSYLAWKTPLFWKVPTEARYLIPFAIIEYLVAVWVCFRFSFFAQINRVGTPVVAVSVVHLMGAALIFMARLYYARSFLLFSYAFSLVWILIGSRFWLQRLRYTRLSIVPGELSERLSTLAKGNSWRLLKEARLPSDTQGLVVDLHEDLDKSWYRLVADSTLKGVPIYHAATLREALTGRVSLDHHPDLVLQDFRVPWVYSLLKRVMDLSIVILTLPIMIPLFFMVGVLIKLESQGPVFFTQMRVGKNGKSFKLYKFRTMKRDSEIKGAQFASQQDQRVTFLGRFFRKFRIDELPQFWNILRGEMSFIGPRPEQAHFVQKFDSDVPFYAYRHLVRPGITGWAQVSHGYAGNLEETLIKLEYDLYYIKHMSLSLDLLVIFKTIRTILTGFGAR